jgi:hypothetical protein
LGSGSRWEADRGRVVRMDIGEELLEERRRRRRAGDPRLSDGDRELLRRLVDGDLKDEFQAALDAVSATEALHWAAEGQTTLSGPLRGPLVGTGGWRPRGR